MLIGNHYSDNRIYRGIRHYDHLPLTSRDRHEQSDTLHMKTRMLLDNIIGSGILNDPGVSLSSTGVSLISPSILLLEGDISLIYSENEILKTSEIVNSGITEGVLCAVGWYQSLTANSTLRSYGGVDNPIIENDLLDENLRIQVSTRYQLRWSTVLLDKNLFYSETNDIEISIDSRDAAGYLLEGKTILSTYSKINDIRVAHKPTSMDYAVSDIYIIPIVQYTYSEGSYTQISTIPALKVKGSGVAPKKYQHTALVEVEHETPVDIIVGIGIEEYKESDILQVSYNGILLDEGVNYLLYDSNSILLKDFTTEIGDTISFTVFQFS